MDYARPEALVSTEWLARHLDDPAIRIVDGTYFMPAMKRDAPAEFAARHIPGAVHFDIDRIAAEGTELPHMLPTPERFAEAVGALGIGNRHRIVVYDQFGLMTAARVWWMFRVFGHDAVAVLDGGLPKWLAEGRPVASGPAEPAPERFAVGFRPALVRSADQVEANIGMQAEQLVDARAAGRFTGTDPEVWPGRRSGHVPGSRNVPFTDLLEGDGRMRPADALARRFGEAGIAGGRPLVASCGSGVTACVVALGLHLLGRDDVAVYDGSWAEWGLPGPRPVATGPADPA